MPLEPGTQLGAYEVVASVGVGGRGEVYRARDTKLGRDVDTGLLIYQTSAGYTDQLELLDAHGALSPDGRFMVIQSDESGRDEIYIAPFPGPGRKWQISTGGGVTPRWREDGRVVFYREPDGRVVAAEIELQGDTRSHG